MCVRFVDMCMILRQVTLKTVLMLVPPSLMYPMIGRAQSVARPRIFLNLNRKREPRTFYPEDVVRGFFIRLR